MECTYLGNKALLNLRKTAFLAPTRIATRSVLRCYDWANEMCESGQCVMSGFSSRMEKEVLHFLLKGKQPIIVVLGRRMYLQLPEALQAPLEQGRLLIISISSEVRQSRQNACRRNGYIADLADMVVFPSIPPEESSLYPIYEKLVEKDKPTRVLLE